MFNHDKTRNNQSLLKKNADNYLRKSNLRLVTTILEIEIKR